MLAPKLECAMSDQTILSASGFIDSIGVNTHAGFGWTGYNNLARADGR